MSLYNSTLLTTENKSISDYFLDLILLSLSGLLGGKQNQWLFICKQPFVNM